MLRLSTRSGLFARPLSVAEATDLVRGWLDAPAAHAVTPGPRHLELLAGLLAEAGTAGNLTSDAHLAALALEGATVTSFDADARFRARGGPPDARA